MATGGADAKPDTDAKCLRSIKRHPAVCRPGNLVQDSVSVMATITPDYFKNFHKFGARFSGWDRTAVGSCPAPKALQHRRQAPAVCACGRKADCVGRTPPVRPTPTSAPPPGVPIPSGLDWKPREYVRWYIDGILVYEVRVGGECCCAHRMQSATAGSMRQLQRPSCRATAA